MTAFLHKLRCYAPLKQSDVDLINSITAKTRVVPRQSDLVREGDSADVVHIILEGFAIGYKLVGNGKRQIFNYLVPGDICDLHVALIAEMDHTVTTLSECLIAEIRRHDILNIVAEHPRLACALWWTMLVDEAVLREWVINIGARKAELRIAHLFCEIHARLEAIGLVTDGVFTVPMSQQELADTVGLSVVHVNRSLKTLRERGLATFRRQYVEIPNIDRMRDFSDFSGSYLNLTAADRGRSAQGLLREAKTLMVRG